MSPYIPILYQANFFFSSKSIRLDIDIDISKYRQIDMNRYFEISKYRHTSIFQYRNIDIRVEISDLPAQAKGNKYIETSKSSSKYRNIASRYDFQDSPPPGYSLFTFGTIRYFLEGPVGDENFPRECLFCETCRTSLSTNCRITQLKKLIDNY